MTRTLSEIGQRRRERQLQRARVEATKQEQRSIRLIGLYVGLAGDNDSEQYNLLF